MNTLSNRKTTHLVTFKKRNSENVMANFSQQSEVLIAAEKLILYYAMNLYLLHENDNCLHLMTKLASKI